MNFITSYKKFNLNMYILFIGLLLTINDVMSFSITKYINLKKFNINFLLFPSLMYSFQIPLFFYALKFSNMSFINIIWNLLSTILVTLIGLFYFKEKVSRIQIYAILLGLISLILFSIDGVI